MPTQQTFVTQLLTIYHGGRSADERSCELPTIDQVKYLCEVGLGPIAFQVYGGEFRHSDPTAFSLLKAADLTTRAIYGQLERAAVELSRELSSVNVRPTFLKGISAADEFYSPPYLRLMADIDVLIKPAEVDLVMARVKGLGYQITDDQWRLFHTFGHHHLPAALHPETGVTIEVHTSLFGTAEFFSEACVFQPDVVAAQTVGFDYKGVRVSRFTPEFQFIFTISKWSVDQSWAVNLASINDTIHILGRYQAEFDCATLRRWFAASPHLFPITAALLHYLEQAGLVTVSTQLRSALYNADRNLGPRTLTLLVWLLHAYSFNAPNRVRSSYARWCAHALWLNVSRPNKTDFGIPVAILRALLRCASYGRYNPIVFVPFRLKVLLYRIRGKPHPTKN